VSNISPHPNDTSADVISPIDTINVGNLATNPVFKYPKNTGINANIPIINKIAEMPPKNDNGL